MEKTGCVRPGFNTRVQPLADRWATTPATWTPQGACHEEIQYIPPLSSVKAKGLINCQQIVPHRHIVPQKKPRGLLRGSSAFSPDWQLGMEEGRKTWREGKERVGKRQGKGKEKARKSKERQNFGLATNCGLQQLRRPVRPTRLRDYPTKMCSRLRELNSQCLPIWFKSSTSSF